VTARVRHRSTQRRGRRGLTVLVVAAILSAAGVSAAVIVHNRITADPNRPLPIHLPATPGAYLGVYAAGAPASYGGVKEFARSIGAKPDVAMCYLGWYQPFPVAFAKAAVSNGAVPLIQMDPTGINVAAIASGKYDAYLFSFATSVHAFHHPVIIGFGHEMNGSWYSWGYGKTSPASFVQAWRHVVTTFRALGARNVTWLWTVNVINDTLHGKIPRPNAWWPGRQYVNWVGIDGYYLQPSWQFVPLFGPTIAAVRQVTSDPILIAETGAVPASGQAAKIRNLFAGIHQYGLLGFVYFDATDATGQDFGIHSPAALAAFRRGAAAYKRP
jgi:mannan endo-1,4-beta-mannosidase